MLASSGQEREGERTPVELANPTAPKFFVVPYLWDFPRWEADQLISVSFALSNSLVPLPQGRADHQRGPSSPIRMTS